MQEEFFRNNLVERDHQHIHTWSLDSYMLIKRLPLNSIELGQPCYQTHVQGLLQYIIWVSFLCISFGPHETLR